LTQVEFAEYKQAAREASVPMPTKAFLMKKCEAIHALRTRRWTEEELQEKLKKSGVIAERHAHIQRVTLRAERRDAERRQDKAAVARVNQQLRELDKGPQLEYGTTKYRSDPDPQPSEPAEPPPPTAAQKAEARKAEMRNWQEKQYQEMLAAKEEEEIKKKTLKKRKFVPKSGSSSGSGGTSPAGKTIQRGENIDMAKMLALECAQYKTPSGMPGVGTAATFDDLMEVIDLGIEIELD
jgi:RNA polymerase-associated protein RTF1